MRSFLYILTCILSCVAAIPSIYMVEPRNSHIFLPRGGKVVNMRVQYQLFDHKASDEPMQFCYDLFSLHLNKNLLEGTCVNFDISSFVLHDLDAGKYMMTSYLRYHDNNKDEIIKETRVINHFTIEEYEDSLPKLHFLTTEKELDFMITNDQSTVADVQFEYTLSDSTTPATIFLVCVTIHSATTNEIMLQQTCLDSTHHMLTLKNVNKGSYVVELVLKDIKSSVIEESSKVSIPLNVKPLVDLLPTIELLDAESEYMLDADTNTAEVSIKYHLEGSHAAINQIRACLRIEKIESPTIKSLLLDTTCVPREHNVFTLSKMSGGQYSATLTLQNEANPTVFYAQRDVTLQLDIRESEEFIPSYEWKRLHAWHTIPSGIVTRLPLIGAYKEGRIPDTWQIQISMPSPCKYFLRMEALRTTTLYDIKKKASAKCKFTPECFLLYSDNVLLTEPKATVESVNYFSVTKRLELDTNSCSVLIEKYRNQQEGAY